jgi:hypothetical protein
VLEFTNRAGEEEYSRAAEYLFNVNEEEIKIERYCTVEMI